MSIRDQHAVDARGVAREGVVLGPRARGQVDVGVHVPHLDVAVVQAGVDLRALDDHRVHRVGEAWVGAGSGSGIGSGSGSGLGIGLG